MSAKTLVCGVGNIFFGDDGFGSAVVRELAATPLPPDVKLVDFGIRSMHLAYELVSGYEDAIILDASPRGNVPGTVSVLVPDIATSAAAADPHSMALDGALSFLATLGEPVPRIRIVACEPANIDDGIGLSEPVERAVDVAAALVRKLMNTH